VLRICVLQIVTPTLRRVGYFQPLRKIIYGMRTFSCVA
jgi:hypothetical protein